MGSYRKVGDDILKEFISSLSSKENKKISFILMTFIGI